MGGGGRSGDGKGGGKRPQQHAKQKGGGSPQHGPHPPGNKGISPTPPGGAQEHAQLLAFRVSVQLALANILTSPSDAACFLRSAGKGRGQRVGGGFTALRSVVLAAAGTAVTRHTLGHTHSEFLNRPPT